MYVTLGKTLVNGINLDHSRINNLIVLDLHLKVLLWCFVGILVNYMWIFLLDNSMDWWTTICFGYNDRGWGTITTPLSGASYILDYFCHNMLALLGLILLMMGDRLPSLAWLFLPFLQAENVWLCLVPASKRQDARPAAAVRRLMTSRVTRRGGSTKARDRQEVPG